MTTALRFTENLNVVSFCSLFSIASILTYKELFETKVDVLKEFKYSWIALFVLFFVYLFSYTIDQGIDSLVQVYTSKISLPRISFWALNFYGSLMIWKFTRETLLIKECKYFNLISCFLAVLFFNLSGLSFVNIFTSDPEILRILKFVFPANAVLMFVFSEKIIRHLDDFFYYSNKAYIGLSTVISIILIICINQTLNSESFTNLFVFSFVIAVVLFGYILFHLLYIISEIDNPIILKILTNYVVPVFSILIFLVWLLENCNYLSIELKLISSSFINPLNAFYISVLSVSYILNYIFMRFLQTRPKDYFLLIIFFSVLLTNIYLNKDESHQQVSLSSEEGAVVLNKRVSSSSYVKNWLQDFDSSQHLDSTIYLVASYGGGIRAAAWTNLVLARYQDSDKINFHDQTLSLSGSSGGMVGLGLYLAFSNSKPKVNQFHQVYNFYNNSDFLSPVVFRLFGIDHIIGLSSWLCSYAHNRHRTLELAFENRIKNPNSKKTFRSPFLSLWNRDTISTPLLLSTSFNGNDGKLGLISPIIFDSLDHIDVLDLIDQYHPGSSISLSTAVFQSARFPFVSPRGTIGNKFHFRDAGFIDNLGAMPTIRILEEIRDVCTDTIKNNLKFKVLLIKNSFDGESELTQTTYLPSEAMKLLNTFSNKTKEELLTAKVKELVDLGFNISIEKEKLNLSTYVAKEDKTLLPLGWYLSTNAFEKIVDASKKIVIN